MTITSRHTVLRRCSAVAATFGLAAALTTAAPAPAEAKGCIRGAVVGGVAGHYAGHGVLGAMGGCVVGRKLANQRAAQARQGSLRQQQQGSTGYNGDSYRSNPSPGRIDAPSTTDANPGATYNGGAYQRRNP